MKISMGCDHGGLELKETIKAHLLERGFEVEDFGTYSKDSCDYPDFARPAAEAVASGACERGILVCTTGIGVSITANKVKGVRCALLSDLMSAKMTRQHNDSNVLCLGGRVIGEFQAIDTLDAWLSNEYIGGRHAISLGLLQEIEEGRELDYDHQR